MPVNRYTMLFSLTTDPEVRAAATSHTGGWSESYWTEQDFTVQKANWLDLMEVRSAMLPVTANIIGYRVSSFLIEKNRLMPTGAFSISRVVQGNPAFRTDLPQVALMLEAYTAVQNNVSRPMLRGMPDEIMVGGEYKPSRVFDRPLTLFKQAVIQWNWGFIGRDLNLAAARVNSLAAGVLTTDAAIVGVAQGDYVRLLRVKDSNGKPIKGAFQVTGIAGTSYTLSPNPGVAVVKANGLVRKDVIRFFDINAINTDRAVIKKVGRPFEQYRGRRSRPRV